MLKICQADVRAAKAWRLFGRRRRKQRRVELLFQTIAAFIPGVVLLVHLARKSVGMSAAQPLERVGSVVSTNNPATNVTVPMEVVSVPEPNTAALLLLALAVIFFLRRNGRSAFNHGHQPSKTATAVA